MKKILMFFLLFMYLLFLAIPAQALQVNLTWDANTEPDRAGYILYYKTDPNLSYIDSNTIADPNATTYTIYNLPEIQHYFVLTCFDTVGLESDYSNEVTTGEITNPYALDPNTVSCSSEGSINYEDGIIFMDVVVQPASAQDIYWQMSGIYLEAGEEYTFSTTAWILETGEVPVSLILVNSEGIPVSQERRIYLDEIPQTHTRKLIANTTGYCSLIAVCGHQKATYIFTEIQDSVGPQATETIINIHAESIN